MHTDASTREEVVRSVAEHIQQAMSAGMEDVGEILDELGPVEAIAADVEHDPPPGDVREAAPTSRWWLLLGSAALSLVLLPLVPFLALALGLATAIASLIARVATAERPWQISAALAISTTTLVLGIIGGLFLAPSPTGGSTTDLPAAPAATE